jgi:hypothetical protein
MAMSQPERKATEKHDYEILFKDSAEYFAVKNAKMIQEGAFVRFITFDCKLPSARLEEDHWYPIVNIHRIKRYHEVKPSEKGITVEPNE